MTCGSCGAAVGDEARFCPECGARQPDEDPAAIAEYRAALEALGGRTEAWAEAELATLRTELRIRTSTHARLLAERAEQARSAAAAPVSVWVDAGPIADFRVGEQCLLRLRVVNESGRALAGVALELETTAATERLTDRTGRALGPGEEHVFTALFRATVAGHHTAAGRITVAPIRGEPQGWQVEPVPFQVGAASALHQQIHIDARSQRVGIFENIGTASKGGLVGGPDWRRVGLTEAAARRAEEPRAASPALPVGRAGVGRVAASGPELTVELDGQVGVLVELADPGLRAVLRPGDQLQVVVIGHDAGGRALLSDRVGSVRGASTGAAAAPGEVRAGPGDPLAAILREVAPGSRVIVSGAHQGPFAIERAVELVGQDGAELHSAAGPVVQIAGDVVLRDLVLRGAAPAGAYAADALEVRSGRVVLHGCTLSSDAPGNLVPGRGVAVTGSAAIELRGCTIAGCGVGVAIDVSWSGFATDTARGARVRVIGGRLERVGVGVAVAGADREVHLSGVALAGGDPAVRVLRGGTAVVEDCAVDQSRLIAEPGGNLVVKGSAAPAGATTLPGAGSSFGAPAAESSPAGGNGSGQTGATTLLRQAVPSFGAPAAEPSPAGRNGSGQAAGATNATGSKGRIG